jgi:hypothetical protein
MANVLADVWGDDLLLSYTEEHMSKLDGAIIYVELERAGTGRVEIYSREATKEEALQMFESVSNDRRAIEDDLASRVAAESRATCSVQATSSSRAAKTRTRM